MLKKKLKIGKKMSEEAEVEVEVEVTPEGLVERAKMYGWHDPNDEDYRGDPKTALGPQDFLDQAEKHPSMKKENFDRLEKKLVKMERNLEQSTKDQEAYIKMQTDAAISDFKAKQRQAVDDGDTDAFDAAEKSIQEAQKPVETTIVPEFDEFKRNNGWYGIDIEKTLYANQVDTILAPRGLSAAEHFNELESEMEKKFPARKAPSVQRNGRLKVPQKSKTFDAMPQDAKDMCNRMMRGTRDPKQFKETFTKTHWSNQDES